MTVVVESPEEDLQLMFQTTGWQHVARPSIEARIRWLMEQLADGSRLEIEKIRDLQCQIRLLREMLGRRFEWFLFGIKDETRQGREMAESASDGSEYRSRDGRRERSVQRGRELG